MKRFVVAAAVAVALGLGTASKADAQIVYSYNVPNAGGVVTGGTVLTPGGYKTFSNYYSPFTGVVQRQVYGSNIFGQSFGRSYGYNPWTGIRYGSGFYQPNYYAYPFGGYNYNFYRRW
jgi:hypothetical protein